MVGGSKTFLAIPILVGLLVAGGTVARGGPPAVPRAKAKQCRRACDGLIADCVGSASANGFGDLRKGCRKAVLQRCKREGTGACATYCGDDRIDGGESCDGANLGGQSCVARGFPGGTLGCTALCTFDESRCQPIACGDGVAEADEECDGNDLRHLSCANVGFLAGTLHCDASCRWDTSGCATSRFVDNGDGTITDGQTELQWEKKTSDVVSCFAGSIHCVSDTYTFPDALSDFIPRVNAAALGGHQDWRLPSFDELATIFNCISGTTCIDAALEPNADDDYWSGQYCCCPLGVSASGYRFAVPGASFCAATSFAKRVRAVRGTAKAP
ncbi:MAG: DUF1566 domain-containing protein [Candidatus Binatia bacterium]